jgi:hypothetical protein
MAEPIIHENTLPFINLNAKGWICVVQAYNVGLIKSRQDHISAISPDAMCVIECSTVGLQSTDESSLAIVVRKLSQFLSDVTDEVENVQDNPQGTVFNFMPTMEYKHKSDLKTQQEARRIRSEILKEDKVVVLNLLMKDDASVFRSAIPIINLDVK